jgi:nickel transport protein
MRPLLAVAVLLAIAPTSAFAHALGVDCILRNGKVEVEVFYDDDSPAQQAKVQVVNAKDEVIANGVTGEKGTWSFAAPPPGTYEVRVDAGAGHRAKKTIHIPTVEPADEPPAAVTINEGRTRAEFTRFPWVQVLIGVIVLGGVGAAFALSTMLRKSGQS